MLNYIWLFLILSAVVMGSIGDRLKEVTDGAIKGAETAVTLSIGLVGIMALWLGVMRVAEKAGLIQSLANLLRPVLRWLFPEVPVNHPAMGSMVLNIAANVLGLTNAATPFGLRAMRDLETLNPHPGVATNAMCTFLAINTSSVQLLPVTAIAVLAASGSASPTAIVGPALAATVCSSIAGIGSVKLLEKLSIFRVAPRTNGAPAPAPIALEPAPSEALPVKSLTSVGRIAILTAAAFFVLILFLMVFPHWFGAVPAPTGNGALRFINAMSLIAIPLLLSLIPLYAALLKLPVYEEFVEGAKEGFNVALRIIPFLVAMLAAIGMFRNAGGIELITAWTRPFLQAVGFPAELLPMSLMRPLSGSGTLALFTDLVRQFGPDHLLTRTAGAIYGSTETTFYVVAVYFGSVGIHRTRHAIAAGLFADAVGVVASIIICRLMFG